VLALALPVGANQTIAFALCIHLAGDATGLVEAVLVVTATFVVGAVVVADADTAAAFVPARAFGIRVALGSVVRSIVATAAHAGEGQATEQHQE
jgi:hypothetical protein